MKITAILLRIQNPIIKMKTLIMSILATKANLQKGTKTSEWLGF